MVHKKEFWWKSSIGYIIYPESYCDSNNDGIGDLKGIVSKLDYIASLGVDLLWICPFFSSPMDDNGYDVKDYRHINPIFGSDEDFLSLIKECHKRGIKLLVDFVLNHTSDEHPFFQIALADPTSKERGYYYIRKGKYKDGKLYPPNNWKGYFSTSAWERIGDSDEFYLHLFSKKMPDVNWGNKELREVYYDIARFYLDLGVDGFRLDAVSHLGKDLSFSDSTLPVDSDGMVLDSSKFANREEVFTYLREFRKEVLDHYDCLTIGEAGGCLTPEESLKMTDIEKGSIDMVFNFDCCWCNGAYGSIDKKDEEIVTDVLALKRNFARWLIATKEHVSSLPLYWCNHDHPRSLSQYGDIAYRKESGKMLIATLLFQYGTPFLYYGDEIGMSNVLYKELSDFEVDVSAKNASSYFLSLGYDKETVLRFLRRCSRVNGRQPMQWGKGEYASFSTYPPKTKVNENYKLGVNVEEEEKDPDSILHFTRHATIYRKKKDVIEIINNGEFSYIDKDNPDIFAYEFSYHGDGLAVISSFRKKEINFAFDLTSWDIVLRNYDVVNRSGDSIILRPYETLVLRKKRSKNG